MSQGIIQKEKEEGFGNWTSVTDFRSCLQCGECIRACPADTISLNKSAIEIDPEKCVNCEICVDTCPAGLIESFEGRSPPKTLVDPDLCIGCSLCVRSCPVKAIEMDPEGQERGRGLAVINAANCIMCDTCAEVCPRDAVNVPQSFR